MTDDPADLSRLHDICLPPDVPWWPLAPGWIILIAVAAVALSYYFFRSIRTWRRNAYRRDAIRALRSADTPARISEVLRRTALSTTPRETIAKLQGGAWPEWLAGQSPVAIPDPVRASLTRGIYAAESTPADLAELRCFAESWIRQHRIPC